jgi:hypothetical protein
MAEELRRRPAKSRARQTAPPLSWRIAEDVLRMHHAHPDMSQTDLAAPHGIAPGMVSRILNPTREDQAMLDNMRRLKPAMTPATARIA